MSWGLQFLPWNILGKITFPVSLFLQNIVGNEDISCLILNVNFSYVLSPVLGRLQDTKQAWCQCFLCFKPCMRQITRHQACLVSMFPMFIILHEADYKTPSRSGANVSYVLCPAWGRLHDTNQAWCQCVLCSKSCIRQITRHQVEQSNTGLFSSLYILLFDLALNETAKKNQIQQK